MKGVRIVMEVILYISVGLVAIAFCVLVVYLISTLKALNTTLHNISNTVESLDGQLKGVTKETQELLHKTNQLADEIQEKTAKLNTVVNAIQDVGTTIQKFNTSLGNVSKTVINQVEENQERISQIVQIGNVVVGLKEKWDEMKKRKKKTNEVVYQED